jgi:hypothetical protein
MSATKQLMKLLLAGAVLRGAIACGQNPATNLPTTPTSAPTTNAAPCNPQPAPRKHGIGSIHLPGASDPNSAVNRACRKFGLCALDPNQSISVPSAETKPCPAPPSLPSAKPVTTPAPSASESKPLISQDGKHLYICGLGTQQMPDLPICKRPDGSLAPMTEIPIPPGSLIKAGPANGASALNANPAPNQSATPLTDAKPNPNAVTSTPTH